MDHPFKPDSPRLSLKALEWILDEIWKITGIRFKYADENQYSCTERIYHPRNGEGEVLRRARMEYETLVVLITMEAQGRFGTLGVQQL